MRILFSLTVILLLLSCDQKKKVTNGKTFNPLYEKAAFFRDSLVSDSAFYYYSIAKDQFLKKNDSLGAAKSLINMAIIQSAVGDYHGSIETSLEANQFLKNDSDSTVKSLLASNYNNIGISSSFLYRFQNATDSYRKAIEFSSVDKNKKVYENNLGDALLSLGKADEAIPFFKKAIKTTDSIDYARALNNLARAKLEVLQSYNPLQDFYKALKIREKKNDVAGQNSSYAALSSYYSAIDRQKALSFAYKMLGTAKKMSSPEDQLQALQKIINLDPPNAAKNFLQFQKLNDSVQRFRNEAKDQFAYIRFGVENEKAENLKLKTDTAQRENQVIRLFFLLGLLILVLMMIFIWFQKRHKIQKQQNELKVKNTELEISKKVHDVVANGIYQVMTEIENQKEFNLERVLYKLENVYEKSRNISYENSENKSEENFHEQISRLLSAFQSESRKIFIVGNGSNIWNGISEKKRENIFHVLQELMVNMKKHSEANIVAVRFEKTDSLFELYYSDNGIGLKREKKHQNGLQNVVNRIKVIEGKVNFETENESGLKINISFPHS